MFKNLFIISCAVLAISGLPYYFQDDSELQSENVGLEAASAKPMAAPVQPAPRQASRALCDRSPGRQHPFEQ